LTFQTTDNQALLVIQDAERADGGQYVLKLKNEAGSAEAPIKVTVLGER